MGDTYCNIVVDKVDKTLVRTIADKVIQHLVDKKIIGDTLTDCVLGQATGYPPGNNYRLVLEDPDDHLIEISTNGVGVNLGRQVFYAGGVDEINCPNCGENIVETDWGPALDEWMKESGNDKIVCPSCTKLFSITEYKFEPNWAFGNVGFTFWNWGSEFKDDFIKDLEQLTGHKINLVYGKL